MILSYSKSFLKRLAKVNDTQLKEKITKALERLKAADSIEELSQVKPLKNWHYTHRYRIGNYRLGFIFTPPDKVRMVAFGDRKEIYKK